MTAALAAQLPSNTHQWSSFPHTHIGLAGWAVVSHISVTCPAQQPAAPPVIRLGLILGWKITPALSGCRPISETLQPRCQSVSQGQCWTSLFVNLFFPLAGCEIASMCLQICSGSPDLKNKQQAINIKTKCIYKNNLPGFKIKRAACFNGPHI